MPTKICGRCGIEKSVEDFHKNKKRKDGLQFKCKTCSAEMAHIWHLSNIEHRRKRNQQWWANNAELGMVIRARRRAKKYNVPFDVGVEDIHIPKRCPILGIKLEHAIGRSGGKPNSPSLDRVIPKLGYVRGNIQVVSGLANRLKSDATPKELLRFAKWVMKTYGA